jgi:DNA repair protein RecO (recombination protein O)
MRLSLQPAFVLHRRPYRDTSLLLEILSDEHGRVGLVARGARRQRSRLTALLQSFTPLLVSWSGNGDLATLTGAEASAPPLPIAPARVFSGWYVNELLLKLLRRHDPHPALFIAYRQVLERLASTEPEAVALRLFEHHLLREIGYGLQLETEALSDRPIVAERHYCYVLDQGPLPAPATGIPVAGHSLLALRQERFPDTVALQEVKRLLQAALAIHLSGPLQTPALLSTLYRRLNTSMGGGA